LLWKGPWGTSSGTGASLSPVRTAAIPTNIHDPPPSRMSKITKQTDRRINLLTTDMKMECHINSVSIFEIIVPNVLSFLTDGDGGNNLVNGDEDSDGNGSKWDEDDDDSDDGDKHNG
jgi:hypothetical protein